MYCQLSVVHQCTTWSWRPWNWHIRQRIIIKPLLPPPLHKDTLIHLPYQRKHLPVYLPAPARLRNPHLRQYQSGTRSRQGSTPLWVPRWPAARCSGRRLESRVPLSRWHWALLSPCWHLSTSDVTTVVSARSHADTVTYLSALTMPTTWLTACTCNLFTCLLAVVMLTAWSVEFTCNLCQHRHLPVGFNDADYLVSGIYL